MMRCLDLLISISFCWAKAPRRMKTIVSFLSDKVLITALVKVCRQISLWELAWSFLTVRVAFKRKTPCLVRGVRFHVWGIVVPTSSCNSL
jgi:hypothetical protein